MKVFWLLPAVLFAAQAFAAPAVKTNICHFDEDEGVWVSISLPATAAALHIANHDDGLPGGTSKLTGTQLDENCQPAAAAPAEQPQ